MAETTEKIQLPAYKRRRLHGACDICKHKKIRCDSANMPNNTCSNCIAFNAECTHANARKQLGPYPTSSTSKDGKLSELPSASTHIPLQQQSSLAESRTIHPVVKPLDSSPSSLDFDTQRSISALSQQILKLEREIEGLKQSANTSSSSREASSSPAASTSVEEPPATVQGDSSSVDSDIPLSNLLKKMIISTSHERHFGLSSSMSLLGVALKVGKEKTKVPISDDNHNFRRPQFWTVHPWEFISEEVEVYDFPDQNLLHELVDLYFQHVNSIFPLLHRPTFEKNLRAGSHLHDPRFGATVLGVCAVASRYTANPAVFLEGIDSPYTAGWKWYAQIRQCWRTSARTALLQDIQAICLSLLYIHGTSQPEACWVVTGIGIRFSQDVGAHRKGFRSKLTPENESWKRCFWLLMCIDAMLCSFLGRPRATTSADYDLDLPVDCDDEFWEPLDPTLAFQQPEGKPSKVSSFIAYINLMEILEYAQLTLYSVNRQRRRGPSAASTDEEIVAHLDSQLNQWFDGMPEHLKWNSCKPMTPFYEQSAFLHACYYHVRILVHRPFIPLPKKPSKLPFPSLAICTNAARSCVRILKAHSDNGSTLPFPQIQFAVFTCGILLIVSHWTNMKSTSHFQDVSSEDLRTVRDCISILANLELRWTAAGRLVDVIREILSYAETSTSAQGVSQSGERQGNTPSVFIPTTFQSQPPRDSYHPDETTSVWNMDILSQSRGWEPHSNTLDGSIDMNSDNTSWWNNVLANEAQCDHGLGLPFYANMPAIYIPDGNSHLPFIPTPGETGMDVGDVAMLWLQAPQLSEWKDIGMF